MGNIDSSALRDDNDNGDAPLGQFIIQYISATDIPASDFMSNSNPYLKSYIAVQTDSFVVEDGNPLVRISDVVQTPARKHCTSAIWNSYRDFYINPPTGSFLVVELCHWASEKVEREPLGSVHIPIEYLKDEEPKSYLFNANKAGTAEKYKNFSVTLRRVYVNRPSPIQKTFFLLRHGESKWNKAQAHRNLGGMFLDRDHALTNTGIEQAAGLNQRWKDFQSEEELIGNYADGDGNNMTKTAGFMVGLPVTNGPPLVSPLSEVTLLSSHSQAVPSSNSASMKDVDKQLIGPESTCSVGESDVLISGAIAGTSPLLDLDFFDRASEKQGSAIPHITTHPSINQGAVITEDTDPELLDTDFSSPVTVPTPALVRRQDSDLLSFDDADFSSSAPDDHRESFLGLDGDGEDKDDDESMEDDDEVEQDPEHTSRMNRRSLRIASMYNAVTLNQINARRAEYRRMFLSADRIYCSPLTRAIETALVALEGHRALSEHGLELYSIIREIKGVGGLDTVGVAHGDAIWERVMGQLEHKLGRQRADQLMADSINVNDANLPWWTNISSFDHKAEQRERILEFISFARYCDAQCPVFVGHSLFFKLFYSKRVSKLLANNRPELASNLEHSRLSNATVLAVTVLFGDRHESEAQILDADIIFGGGFHGGDGDLTAGDDEVYSSQSGNTAGVSSGGASGVGAVVGLRAVFRQISVGTLGGPRHSFSGQSDSGSEDSGRESRSGSTISEQFSMGMDTISSGLASLGRKVLDKI